jgi:RNA polymerase sigma-70 factor (ECF subfamily)
MDIDTGGPAVASDAAVVARLRSGDARTFESVVGELSPVMLRVARGYVPTEASAQDVVQETWLAVIRGLPGFEGRSTLRTWVLSILINLARRRGVRDRRTVPMATLGTDDGPAVAPSSFRPPGQPGAGGWRPEAAPQEWGPEARALTAEVRGLLSAGIERLPPRQREVLVLRDVDGLSTQEVADGLGLSEGNVRVLLHRARVRLREELADYHRGDGREVRR